MTVSGSSGVTQVTGNVVSVPAITVPSDNQTLIRVYWESTASATVLYTVPAGKIFYLMSIESTFSSNFVAQFDAPSGTQLSTVWSVANTKVITHAGTCPLVVLTAGQTIDALVGTTASSRHYLTGVLMDA